MAYDGDRRYTMEILGKFHFIRHKKDCFQKKMKLFKSYLCEKAAVHTKILIICGFSHQLCDIQLCRIAFKMILSAHAKSLKIGVISEKSAHRLIDIKVLHLHVLPSLPSSVSSLTIFFFISVFAYVADVDNPFHAPY